jgi:hypothetical protein
VLPGAADVAELVVSENRHGDHEIGRVTDRAKITTVLEILAEHNSGYSVPLDTFPGPDYTILFHTHSGQEVVVWVGANWLGGRELRPLLKDKRLREVTPEEKSALFAALGIKHS